jgi:hypothetical protein
MITIKRVTLLCNHAIGVARDPSMFLLPHVSTSVRSPIGPRLPVLSPLASDFHSSAPLTPSATRQPPTAKAVPPLHHLLPPSSAF